MSATTMLSGLSQGSLAAVTDANNDNMNDTVTFTFGDIVNTPDGISQGKDDTLIFEIVALVSNSTVNVQGLQLASSVQFYYTGSNNFAIRPAAVSARIVEPLLSITKSGTPATNLEASNIVTYTVVISHKATSNSTAYGLLITDNLVPSLALIPGSVQVTGVNNVTSGYLIFAGDDGPSDTKVGAYIDSFNPKDTSITITYKVVLATVAISGQIINNHIDVQYASAPIDANNVASIRNRTSSASASVVTVAPNMTISYLPGNNDVPPTAGLIGELVTFTANITLPQGTTQNSSYVVSLPAANGAGKMSPLSATIRYMPSTASSLLTNGSTVTGTDTNNDQIPDTVTFNFGTIVNSPHTKGDPLDLIIIDVVAVVDNDPTTTPGQHITSTFQFTYLADTFHTQTQTVTLQLIAPQLQIAKAVTPTAAVQGGDVLSYTVTVSHIPVASTAPAFHIEVTDALSEQLALVPGSISTTRGTATAVNNTVVVDLALLPMDGIPIVITYTATMTAHGLLNGYVNNTASVSYVTSALNDLNSNYVRQLSASSLIKFHTNAPTFSFSLNSTTISQTTGNQVAIGEAISLLAIINIPPGEIVDAVVKCNISNGVYSPGLLAIPPNSGRIASMPTAITSSRYVQGDLLSGTNSNHGPVNDTITFNLGIVSNHPPNSDNRIILEIIALVVDEPFNSNSVALAAQCMFNYSNTLDVYTLTQPKISFTIVEPKLLVNNTATPNSNIQAGNIVSYNLTIWHAPASSSVAFDLNIVDLMSNLLTLIPGTVTCTIGQIAKGNAANDTTISIVVGNFAPNSGVIYITYKANLTNLAPPNSIVPDSPNVFYFSSPANPWNAVDVRGAFPNAVANVCLQIPR